MPIKIRIRWIPLLATVMVVVIGVSLGQWQTRRAVEKEAIEQKLSERASAPAITLGREKMAIDTIEYRRLIVRGEFDKGWPIYLENRPHDGVAGFHVLMPFKIADSDMHLLVARGWAPRATADRAQLPKYDTPVGITEIQGIAVRKPGHVMQLGDASAIRPSVILQNLDIEQFSAASKLAMQGFMLEQTNDAHDGLVRDWPRPSTGIERHRGYAFQWYGLALTALIFFVVTGFRRGK